MWSCVVTPGAPAGKSFENSPAGSSTTLSGGAIGAEAGAAPIAWNSESAAGRSTTPLTVI